MAKSRNEKLAEELMRFGRQAKQGATFGFADEIQDILAAVPAAALTDMSYKEALTLARELSKGELSNDWQESPWVSGAGQVVGGIPLGLGKLGAYSIGKFGLVDDALKSVGVSKLGRGIANAGQAATDWIRSGSALSGIGKGAAVGAGFGGTAGLGAADDTIADRLGGFGLGAGIGGLVGGATAPLARIGSSGDVDYRKVTEKTAKGFDNKAQQELARQLAARPDLQEQLARAEAMTLASKNSGIPLTLAEALAQSGNDHLLAQQANLISNPMTAGRMEAMYAARSGTPEISGQIEQRLIALAQGLDPSIGSYDEAAAAVIGQADKAAGDITRQLTSQARPLYDQAYQMNIPQDDAILQNPLIRSALEKVRNNPVFAQEIGNSADNSIQALDAVKRILDDMAEAANRSGNRNEARLIQNAKTQLLGTMKQASPEYGEALSVYSGNPDALQMRQHIGSLAGIDPMDAKSVGRELFSGTQQNADLTAQALGDKAPTAAAMRIYGALDTSRNDLVNIVSKIAPDRGTRGMLRSYAGNQYEPIAETLNVINQAKLGERMRSNSATQPLQKADKTLETAANAAIDVASGGKTTILRRIAGMLGRGSQETDPQFYSDMADLMLTDQGMDLVRRVATGQQNAIQELQTVGLPSLLTGGAARATTSLPVARAGIGMLAAPQNESVLRLPQEDRFSEFDKILQQQYTPQQTQRFDEFDRLLGVR